MIDPVTGALVAGGLSLISGLGARQAAKKQAKTQAAHDLINNMRNAAAVASTNKENKALGRALMKKKEITTEQVDRTTEHAEGGSSWSEVAQDNYSFVDVDAMMDAADRAGFNPQTWLNAGGMQAYTQTGSRSRTDGGYASWSRDVDSSTTTTTRKGHNAVAAMQLMSPESALVTSSAVPKIPTVAEAVGDAGAAALKTYREDSARLQGQDFQREMLGKQIQAIQDNNARTMSRTVNQGTPSYSTSGETVTGGKTGSLSPRPSLPGELKLGDAAEATVPFTAFGLDVDRRWPDAGGAVTQRYGEAAEMLYGLGLMGVDAWKNVPLNLKRGITEPALPATTPPPYKRTYDWLEKNIADYLGSIPALKFNNAPNLSGAVQ